jgi:hypothetical protein
MSCLDGRRCERAEKEKSMCIVMAHRAGCGLELDGSGRKEDYVLCRGHSKK